MREIGKVGNGEWKLGRKGKLEKRMRNENGMKDGEKNENNKIRVINEKHGGLEPFRNISPIRQGTPKPHSNPSRGRQDS